MKRMDNKELQRQIDLLKREMNLLRSLVSQKTGLGSATIRGNIVQPSTVAATIASNTITNAMMKDDSIKQAELDTETANVTVSAGNPSGTATVTSGSVILGWRATGNQDQFIDNMAVSGTTLTITLSANAIADNTFQVTLLKA